MLPPDPRKLIGSQPVIPVLTIHDPAKAVPLARALAAGGLPAIEVTLRTASSLVAIEQIARNVPEAVVGAGTVVKVDDIPRAIAAGSRFIVTPGTTPDLIHDLALCGIPSMPGVATVSEALHLSARGFSVLKFFPAESNGGAAWLKAVSAPLRDVIFCPTGGIDIAKAPAYLALPNVPFVGGSWVAPDSAIAANDWATIEKLAAEAAALGR